MAKLICSAVAKDIREETSPVVVRRRASFGFTTECNGGSPLPAEHDNRQQRNKRSYMEKLSTIQKRENLNDVFICDEAGNGGANHKYSISSADEPADVYAVIQFQNGARKLPESIHGVLDTDLLEIVRHRLQAFQKGQFATRENAVALTHIEEALLWMNKRVEDRIERNVLGTNNK